MKKPLEEQSITPHQFPRIKLLLLTFPCVPLRWILGTCKKQRRVETPAEVKHFQESLQPNHFNWAEKKLDRCKSDAVSQHELKGVEMRRKRWKESREERCQNLTQELKSSGQMMEDCPSSYCQNFFLVPIALHFVNLETSTCKYYGWFHQWIQWHGSGLPSGGTGTRM